MNSPFPYIVHDRNTRRAIEKLEREQRASGKWAPWKQYPIAPDTIPTGSPKSWLKDVHTVHSNGWLVVQVRTCRTSWGMVEHANIRTATSTDLTWAEKQRLKNEIFGPARTGLEVFPATDRLVDEAMMYHLWILPAEMNLPFGIHKSDLCSDKHFRP